MNKLNKVFKSILILQLLALFLFTFDERSFFFHALAMTAACLLFIMSGPKLLKKKWHTLNVYAFSRNRVLQIRTKNGFTLLALIVLFGSFCIIDCSCTSIINFFKLEYSSNAGIYSLLNTIISYIWYLAIFIYLVIVTRVTIKVIDITEVKKQEIDNTMDTSQNQHASK